MSARRLYGITPAISFEPNFLLNVRTTYFVLISDLVMRFPMDTLSDGILEGFFPGVSGPVRNYIIHYWERRYLLILPGSYIDYGDKFDRTCLKSFELCPYGVTLSFYFRQYSKQGGETIVIRNSKSLSNGGFNIKLHKNDFVNGNQIRVKSWTNLGHFRAFPKSSMPQIELNRWYFFAIVFHSSSIHVYRDADLYAFSVQSDTSWVPGDRYVPFTLRSKDAESMNNVLYYLDDMVVRNRALSEEEIRAEMQK